MSNDFYNVSGAPVTGSPGASAVMRAEFASLESAFDKLPVLSGHGSAVVIVNSGATGLSTTATVPIAQGGTNAATAADARTALGTNDAANLTTGTVPTARLGSGTANSTTFLRGDSTWVASTSVTSVDVSGGATGLTTSGGPVTGTGTITLAGTLAIANGGTGATSAGAARTALGVAAASHSHAASDVTSGTIDTARLGSGTANSGTFLRGDQTWVAISGSGTVTSVDVSGGTTGLTTSGGPVTGSGTVTLAGTLGAANGGTGLSSYTAGDLLYASGTTTVAKLAGAATGQVLLSGGVGTAPAYGKVGLTTHVNGTLPVTNGGTGASTLNGVLKGAGSGAVTMATAGTDYLAPPTGTAILKANSGGALANATAGTDYVTPSGSETLTNKTITAPVVTNMKLTTAREAITVSATAASGTINYDALTQSLLYYTTNASGHWTLNLRGSSGTAMNSMLATGEAVTVTFLAKQGSTAKYNNVVQVDGTTSGVTTVWQGGSAPSSGNPNSIDVYTYTIVKTGSSAFTVFAAQTQFA